MILSISFYISLAICLLGTLYRISKWFSYRVGSETEAIPALKRAGQAGLGIIKAVFSPRLIFLLISFVSDVMLQFKILRQNFSRWLMHFLIFSGFMLLLIMHALGNYISLPFVSDYEPTLNPFMFLRNLFGIMVLIGIGIALYRRKKIQALQKITSNADRFAIVLLITIILSGFCLEAAKIISASMFDQMVYDYADSIEPEELAPLKVYWANDFGIVFPDTDLEISPKNLDAGKEVHGEYCASCHIRPTAAFASYALAKAITPIAQPLDRYKAIDVLRYLHLLSCFISLALLPFSKYFHIVSSPISLLLNSVSDPSETNPISTANRRAIDLDGCTHCGTCSLRCSVAPLLNITPNPNIIPSEKLISIKAWTSGKSMTLGQLQAVAFGSHLCTNCFRCTRVCPSGLNLQDMWLSTKIRLSQQGYSNPCILAMNRSQDIWSNAYTNKGTLKTSNNDHPGRLGLYRNRASFKGCFKCKTCTNSCPVVAACDDIDKHLGLAPHQIMHALSMGFTDMAATSKMVWSCITCYACQENCPQNVRVTDILYELKNMTCDLHRQGMNGKT